MEDITETGPVILNGTPASPGVAIGAMWLVSHRDLEIPTDLIEENDTGVQFDKAKSVLLSVEEQLDKLQEHQSDAEVCKILDAQVQIVRDPELLKRVEQLIKVDKKSAEYALFSAFNEFIQLLRQSGQAWVNDRLIDLQSLRDKIIHQFSGSGALENLARGSVLFAEELSPTEVIEFSDSGIGAIVMQHGGTTSHAVIIAQSLGIPCVVGVNWRKTQLDDILSVAVDADAGEVVLNPDEKTLVDYRKRIVREDEMKQKAVALGRRPNQTVCGSRFYLRANIEFKEELQRVREYRAEGVGLLRTETLFLRQGYFDEKRHAGLYRTVLQETGVHPVMIRLLDVGGDKLPGRKLVEANPFLGWRGIRMLLDEGKLLHKQLEAILKVASEFPARIQILLPMVTDVSELREVKRRIAAVEDELQQQGFFSDEPVPVGIMVEVPAIALQAEEAAKEADFFSIGSNDLTQYVLAADRGNELVSSRFKSGHPAVLKLIKMACDAAATAGIPVSVCGEMAGQPVLAAVLMGLGVRELSMNPASIPAVKKLLCNHEMKTFNKLQDSLLETIDGEDAERLLDDWKKHYMD